MISTVEADKVLQENPNLAVLISHAEIKLQNYFGLTLLYLEAVGADELLMSIATKLPPKDALKNYISSMTNGGLNMSI